MTAIVIAVKVVHFKPQVGDLCCDGCVCSYLRPRLLSSPCCVGWGKLRAQHCVVWSVVLDKDVFDASNRRCFYWAGPVKRGFLVDGLAAFSILLLLEMMCMMAVLYSRYIEVFDREGGV